MSGDEIREGAVLAAVKPLKTVESTRDAYPVTTENSMNAAEPSALETLFRTHHDRVFRTAYRVTGSAEDAEDVLQTVFLRIAREQESRSADNPQAYFARAAINASLDLLRRKKRSRLVALEDVEHDTSLTLRAGDRSPEADQEDRELRALIRDAVSKLGQTAAQMFALRYFEGLDNGEIARAMGTSALVVGVTLHRARARLRKEIGKYLKSDGR